MSTKQTILYRIDEKTGAGFHLYQDLLELDDDGNCPVHLELNAVQFEAGAGWLAGGGGVDVTIPRLWAEALGLVGNSAAAEIEKLRGEKLRLETAIQRTLDENGHLADGDDCTLIHLVRAMPTADARPLGGEGNE
ncbi:MAG: hypothetical protein IPM06_17640 [Rhizobiales bacterium]|nr:hypothetical protein [Hyphomicrobiales bacterium]